MTESDHTPSARGYGKARRSSVPRSSHAAWVPHEGRPNPVRTITNQNADRIQWLVPVRHWRMSESPFTFYRGAAAIMAEDLSHTPTSGITVQICGDAHLSNFGAYGSPDRELVFDLNDFDETLPGPWEWDVKRLAASFSIAARHNGLDRAEQAALAVRVAKSYRKAMREFSRMGYLDAWYSRLSVDDIYDGFADQLTKKEKKSGRKFSRKAKRRDSLHVFRKLAEVNDGEYQIIADPPLLIPLRDFPPSIGPTEIRASIEASFTTYFESLPDQVEALLRRFRFCDLGLKVVGVGSVGTRCYIILLEGRDSGDPFFLQVKEANRSVLEDHLPESRYETHGERVVAGQRVMQASSDVFLGWEHSAGTGSHFYWRQLKDMKASPDIESASPEGLYRFARLCGWILARAHARSGRSEEIAGYLGAGKTFDHAIGEFALAYADQNDADFAAFASAIESGEIASAERP
jgi:uncharacterized protein (DUF2252 family)